ncbi:MAG: glycosyltransferase family 4 protein, partial [Candidatus Rokubacteria bacterium]|nr:glycosyltransferase family 4 protein [Candidatus Rokubacteria bacterium]
MKLAIVHDYLIQYGGAERVVEVLHGLFPAAPIFTSVYHPAAFPEAFRRMDIRPSFLQRVAVRPREMQRWLLPLYPLAFQRMDLRDFDVVLSSASAFAKGVRPRPPGRHICYCYAPTRFLWQHEAYATQEGLGPLARASMRILVPWLRRWDLAAA